MANRNCVDMTQGPILRKLLTFALPLMLNYVVNIFYQMADNVIAGQFLGANAMAAVGASAAPLALIISFFYGIGGSVPILCGNYIGKRDPKALRECIHTAPIIGLLIGLLVCALGLALSASLLRSANIPEEIFEEALLYLNIRLSGVPLALCSTFCVGILSSHGDTKRLTVSGLISGGANLLGNIVFVIFTPLGIAGIALSTNLSILLQLVIYLAILFSPKDNYRMKLSEMKLHIQHTKKMLALGLPAGLSNLMFNFSNNLTQSSINTFGPTVIAGITAADVVDQFVSVFPVEMQTAIGCAAAQCYGAGNIPRIHEITKKGVVSNVLACLLVCSLVTIFANPLMSIFVNDPAVTAAGIQKLMFSCWGSVVYSISLVYNSALRGMQKPKQPLIVNLVAVCLFKILWIWFVFPHFKTITALYLMFPLSSTISAVLMAIAYHRTRRTLLTTQSTSV